LIGKKKLTDVENMILVIGHNCYKIPLIRCSNIFVIDVCASRAFATSREEIENTMREHVIKFKDNTFNEIKDNLAPVSTLFSFLEFYSRYRKPLLLLFEEKIGNTGRIFDKNMAHMIMSKYYVSSIHKSIYEQTNDIINIFTSLAKKHIKHVQKKFIENHGSGRFFEEVIEDFLDENSDIFEELSFDPTISSFEDAKKEMIGGGFTMSRFVNNIISKIKELKNEFIH